MKIVLLALLLASKATDVVKGIYVGLIFNCMLMPFSKPVSFLVANSGVVEISPSVVAPVCQTGDQLELTCSLIGRLLRWEYTVRLENGAPITVMPTITSGGTSGVL